jgi:putative ATPase
MKKKLLSSKLDKEAFIQYSGGDARKLINSIELVLINSKIQRKRNYQRRCAFGFARNNGTL